ncbi:nitrate transporter family protein [Salix suchowensis]|nr:nitrate transporter family protein [Salix suchowensis]
MACGGAHFGYRTFRENMHHGHFNELSDIPGRRAAYFFGKICNHRHQFHGTLNLLGLLGGFLADAKLGRYLTVAIFASITALGIGLLTMATTIPSMRPHSAMTTGNNNISVSRPVEVNWLCYTQHFIPQHLVVAELSLMSQVLDPISSIKQIPRRRRQCFSSSTVLVYIQDNVGRGWGYGISAGTMVIGVAVLLCGTPWYRFKKPRGSPLTTIWRVSLLAWKKRNLPHPCHPSLLNDYDSATVPHTEKFKCLDKAAIMDDPTSISAQKNDPFIVSTVMEVEEVKMVLKLIPIWSTCILFWTVYSQMTTFTVEQATFMNRKVGSLVIPSGSYSTFLFITILLFTSLNERVFVPLARKLTGNAQGLTSLQRIGTGLSLSILAMMAAAVIEKERRETAIQQNTMISAFWLVPQYFLVGAGEAFAYVGQLEFFIREAPERMKSMSTGLFLSTISMGFFVSSLLVSLVDKATKKTWLRSNLNKGRLNNFYWMLALLGLLNLFVFLVFARGHQYKVQHYIKPKNSDEEELKPANDLTVLQVVKEEGTI